MTYRLGEKLTIKGEMPVCAVFLCLCGFGVVHAEWESFALLMGVMAVTEKSCIFVGE